MGLLTGDIASAIYAGFKGKLLTGTLVRDAPSAALDTLGDPVSTTTQTWPCEGFVDNYSAFIRMSGGIPATDSKVCIFAKSLPSGVRPQKDDRVTMTMATGVVTGTWQLRDATVDPAGALWECRAFAPGPDA